MLLIVLTELKLY